MRVGAYFRSKNQKVWGIIRTPERKRELEQLGITPLVTDLAESNPFNQIPLSFIDFVIISLSPEKRDAENYKRVYLEGVRNLLTFVESKFHPKFVLYLSSTGVYRDYEGKWIDEKTPPEPDSEREKILLEAESQVLNSAFPSAILRLGGIYGPERNRIKKVQERLTSVEPDKYLNLIHVDDIVRTVPLLLSSAEVGQVYLGVDDEPVPKSELYSWLRLKLGIPVEEQAETRAQLIGGKRCRNTRLKNLGFTFQYPTFREGYESLF